MADKETELGAEGAVEVVEEEYESDLDDAPLPAVRRRAAASDEEEGEYSEEDGPLPLPRRKAGSDEESDGQGAPEVYDQDLYEEEEDEGGYEEYEEDFEQGRGGVAATEAAAAPREAEGVKEGGEAGEAPAGEEDGKKESEPFAVPTTGAFYMHDDRFQEARGGRGRGRRMLSNRKLWPKEEQEWVHDRFDEMHPRDYNNGNIRNLRGRFRGRGGGPGGRTRGVSRGNFRGGNRSQSQYHDGNQNYCYVPKGSHISHDNTKNSRQALPENLKTRAPKPSQAHSDDVNNFDVVPKENRTYYADSRNQPSHKNTQRVIRGRGSKRYQPRWRSTTELSSEQNNKSQNPENASSNANLGKQQPQNSNSRPGQVFAVKQSSASNLNSASPPFYPSRPPHRELPAGPSVGLGEAGTGSPALHSSPSSSNSQFPIAVNQVIRDSVQSSHPVVQQWSVQSSTQSTPRMPSQMFRARIGISDEMPSSMQAVSTVSTEDTGISSPRGSNKVISRLTLKGQHGGQGEEHAPFLYGRGQVLGATGSLSLGDQGFHGTPALFPVMQFGGQHPGRPGVPSIGMALPGFVSQQQLGLGNSEMAWLPILAGSSGGLGATYGSPYIAMDGNYYSRPSEQASSSVSPREPSAISAPSQLKSPEITEVVNDELIQRRVVNDELSQRRNKPRRYSEMNFGQ